MDNPFRNLRPCAKISVIYNNISMGELPRLKMKMQTGCVFDKEGFGMYQIGGSAIIEMGRNEQKSIVGWLQWFRRSSLFRVFSRKN